MKWIRGYKSMPPIFKIVEWRNADGGNIPLGKSNLIDLYKKAGANINSFEWLAESPTSPPTAHTEELSTPPVREAKSAEEFHNEFITCPNCKEINHAKVLHTIPFGTYIHDCSKCGYTIMESEWDKLPYQKELEDYIKKYYPQLCTPQPTPHKEGYSVEQMEEAYNAGVSEGMSQSSSFEWGARRKGITFKDWMKDDFPHL